MTVSTPRFGIRALVSRATGSLFHPDEAAMRGFAHEVRPRVARLFAQAA
jgi:hypothetical protein